VLRVEFGQARPIPAALNRGDKILTSAGTVGLAEGPTRRNGA